MSNQERIQQAHIDRSIGYAAGLACIAAEGLARAKAMLRIKHGHTFGFWCGWLHACACCARA